MTAGQGYANWQELRDHAIGAFNGETPHPITETEIIAAYELHPDAVAKTIDQLAADVKTGAIRSGWAVLRKRASTISTAPANPQRDTGVQREKRVMRAEQWLRATGVHFDRETEITDELFGDRGLLLDYHDDHALETRMTTLWHELRPKGEQLEADTLARAQAWKTQQQNQLEIAAATRAALDAKQLEHGGT